jgi:hypothetical protein
VGYASSPPHRTDKNLTDLAAYGLAVDCPSACAERPTHRGRSRPASRVQHDLDEGPSLAQRCLLSFTCGEAQS